MNLETYINEIETLSQDLPNPESVRRLREEFNIWDNFFIRHSERVNLGPPWKTAENQDKPDRMQLLLNDPKIYRITYLWEPGTMIARSTFWGEEAPSPSKLEHSTNLHGYQGTGTIAPVEGQFREVFPEDRDSSLVRTFAESLVNFLRTLEAEGQSILIPTPVGTREDCDPSRAATLVNNMVWHTPHNIPVDPSISYSDLEKELNEIYDKESLIKVLQRVNDLQFITAIRDRKIPTRDFDSLRELAKKRIRAILNQGFVPIHNA